MKLISPSLIVMITGLLLMLGAGVALATDPPARGGQAIPTFEKSPGTTKAPPMPKHGRRIACTVPFVPGVLAVKPARCRAR